MTAVQIGQTYRDNSSGMEGRTFKVVGWEDDKAVCEVLTNTNEVQGEIDDESVKEKDKPQDQRGSTTKIAIARLEEGRDYTELPDAPSISGPY